MSEHGHGPIKCIECAKTIASCRCLGIGETVRFDICTSCKDKAAQAQMKRMSEVNRELRKLGIVS